MAGIYIHIPFCKQACHYCNFYFSTSLANKDKFIEAIIAEIELSKTYLGNEPITTLYFGGGTPSLLPTADLLCIIQTLGNKYDLSGLQELTLEANPDDLSISKVKQLTLLREFGPVRFSIG